jgi:hypothetical protein
MPIIAYLCGTAAIEVYYPFEQAFLCVENPNSISARIIQTKWTIFKKQISKGGQR